MNNSNRPKWLDVTKLANAAGDEVKQQNTLNVNLPVRSHKVIATYVCPQCRLQYTSSDVEVQVKKAARTGTQYIECPKCGGILREGSTAVVRDTTSIVNRAEKYIDSNKAPSRSIDTWVDKAIYGRLVQKLGEHIQQYGIDNPQLKFQRGIRAQKFPGHAKTAKGAEFTVEFVDFNNTRNRIIIQAGLDIKGELIYPRTFRTLSGAEYPLTKQAIDDLTSGKVYDPVMSDATISPLTYRYPDPVRFREISADNSKMKKTAMDPAAMDAEIQNMGVTDPNDIQAMKNVLIKYKNTPAGSTPIGEPSTAVNPDAGGGAFMNGVGLSSKLNMKKKAEFPINEGMQESDPEDYSWEQIGHEALYSAVADGLSFPEVYDSVRNATQGNVLITQEEFETMGQIITDSDDNMSSSEGEIFARATELIKQAETDSVKQFYKTADSVRDEFTFNSMNSLEANQWVTSYVNTHNKLLDLGKGIVVAANDAQKIATDMLIENRVKYALRDKDTLVPQVDTDPDWSIATTDEFEAEFGGKYEDTDGGILPVEDRGYSTMFKGASIVKSSAFQLTPSGDAALDMLGQGQELSGFNTQALQAVLMFVMTDPNVTSKDLLKLVSVGGPSPYQLQVAFDKALEGGYIEVLDDMAVQQLDMKDVKPLQDADIGVIDSISTKLTMQKDAEATGIDLDADEVGQNPINYSRLKGQVQDLLRAGNIPPSKVDMHKLKDGGYSLEELRNLIDSFKVDKDTYFPTAHAEISEDQMQKKAEEKLSDLFKQMPLEKDDEDNIPPRRYKHRTDDKKLPSRKTETCPNKDDEGNIPPRQWKNRRDDNV